MQTLELPQSLQSILSPLFDALPLDQAMAALIVHQPISQQLTQLVGKLVSDPAMRDYPKLQAALWLYVDELDRSHQISQHLKDAEGSYWHGIMHRREGDFSNSHYWFHNAGANHRVYSQIQGYDPHQLIDDVQNNPTDPKLVELQRSEWIALVNHCVSI
ncbi:MAG TPA: hypothetical protein DCM28_20145 [Phycisphaerales bacterium]|nr:hypothetical protein [Phycisphaerales bacterium]HCD31861.1 hypothetical protein [Phycisphaerales bacterium]